MSSIFLKRQNIVTSSGLAYTELSFYNFKDWPETGERFVSGRVWREGFLYWGNAGYWRCSRDAQADQREQNRIWYCFIECCIDGNYSVPSKCREINFTKQGGNKLPHSKERCHARKSKIHSNIFELKSSVFCSPFEVSMFDVQIIKIAAPAAYVVNFLKILRFSDTSASSILSARRYGPAALPTHVS